jgi:heme exporter protein D
MYFHSLDALLYMDGHGAYVWAAYAVTAVVVAGLLVIPRRRQRRQLLELAGELRRKHAAPTQTPSATQEDEHASGA